VADEQRMSEDSTAGGIHLADRLLAEPHQEVADERTDSDMPGAHRAATRGSWLDALGLAEGGLLADVGVVLALASIYLPLVGPFLAPAVPTPFAVLMLRRGPRVTLLAVAVAAFLLTVLTGPHFGWRIGLEAAVGMVFGGAMRRRTPPILVWSLGTVIVATTTFLAALGIIFLTGLPISDVVAQLRNLMIAVASVVALLAPLLNLQGQWLALRPSLATLAVAGLHVWPLLLYLNVVVFALPTVALYYAIANAAVRVLGHDVPVFPPTWSLRVAAFTLRWTGRALRPLFLVVAAPVLLPRRLLRRTPLLRAVPGEDGR
jgi:uncharacterized protein YybS (DUF2232 family)